MPECIGFSEIGPVPCGVLRYRYPGITNYGNATELVCDELPDFDFLCGGFPCQDFSIAGKRQGIDGARGTLFFEIARVLSHKRPRHFLLENVKGLLSSDNGQTYPRILRVLADLDYRVETVVLNSKHYGVPQNRERVFFIGHLGSECQREILSFGEVGELAFENSGQGVGVLSGAVDSNYHKGPDGKRTMIQDERVTVNRDTAHAVRVGGQGSYGTRQNWDCYEVGTLRTYKDGEGFRTMSEQVSPTLNGRARQDGSQQTIIALKNERYAVPVLTPDRVTKRQNGRRMKEDGEASFTVTAQDQHGVMLESNTLQLQALKCIILLYANATKTNTNSILSLLQKEARTQEVAQKGNFRSIISLYAQEVLRSEMYGEDVLRTNAKDGQELGGNAQTRSKSRASGRLLQLWQEQCKRCASQGWRPHEQSDREFDETLQELSFDSTRQTKEMSDLWQSAKGLGILREALPAFQKIWQSFNVQTESALSGRRIRRLTPVETARLQAFPDDHADFGMFQNKQGEWHVREISDTGKYQVFGNAVTTSVIEALITRMIEKGCLHTR